MRVRKYRQQRLELEEYGSNVMAILDMEELELRYKKKFALLALHKCMNSTSNNSV